MGMKVIGIDPGKSGGVAYLGGPFARAYAMPVTERDIWLLIKGLVDDGAEHAYLEKVHSMPGQGVKSMFTFGDSFGFLKGCLTASGVSWEMVPPKNWLKTLGVIFPKDSSATVRKNLTKAKAQSLFPNFKMTHAIADALLIAEHGRRTRKAQL